jgi:hypothetical protein
VSNKSGVHVPAALPAAVWPGSTPASIDIAFLRSSVCRMTTADSRTPKSIIAKRLTLQRAQLEQLATRAWLPDLGLSTIATPLMTVVPEPAGDAVWHVYEDLGDGRLDHGLASAGRLEAAVAALARLHSVAADHPLLGDVRLVGRDLGAHFYQASARDARRWLRRLEEAGLLGPAGNPGLVARLEQHVAEMLDNLPRTVELFDELSGPETLLHGDIAVDNTFVAPRESGFDVRFIDWDHAGVGPACYDMSNFLAALSSGDRQRVIAVYRKEVSAAGWIPDDAAASNELFAAAELARLANRIIWTAPSVWGSHREWAFEELGRIEMWFASREPLLAAP